MKRYQLTPQMFKVLHYIENVNNGFSSTELAEVFGVCPKTIRNGLRDLVESNVVTRVPRTSQSFSYLVNSEEDWQTGNYYNTQNKYCNAVESTLQ